MSSNQAHAPTPPTPDQPDPGPENPRPESAESDGAIDQAIRDWTAKMKEVEAIRRREMVPRETNDILDDLRTLRAYCMGAAERADREGRGLLTFAERDAAPRGTDPALKLMRLARAVRQIAVLQLEMLGQRPVAGVRAAETRSETQPRPAQTSDATAARTHDARERNDHSDRERGDLNDLYDYDDRSYGEVIAAVGKSVGFPADPDVPVASADRAKLPAHVNGGHNGGHRARLNASASILGANLRERGPP